MGNVFRELRESTETDAENCIKQEQLSNELNLVLKRHYGTDEHRIAQSTISKLERGATPNHDHLIAYSLYFNVTTDYLLGLRDTKPVNEDLAMVSKYTGLSDTSLSLLKNASKGEKAVLNAFVETSLKTVTEMTQDFYDDLGGKLIYNGREMNKEISEEFEESLFIQRLKNVFHSITHNKKVTDLFSQAKWEKYIESLDQLGLSEEASNIAKKAAAEVLEADLNGEAYDRMMNKMALKK